MAHFPFWDRYPFTNFEQLNLDYLLNETSKFSKRVADLETITANHEVRIGTLETNVEDLTGRVGALETDVGDLKDRMTEAEGDIYNLQGRMNDVEDGIEALETGLSNTNDQVDDLKTRMSTAESNITNIEGDITTIEGNITNIEGDITDIHTKDQSQDNELTGLDSRVTALENSESVIANPGGTGPLLNTVSISGTTYSIDNSGGGGGGSSVTPNPSGTPTQTLEKVDIDGTIYGMPVTTQDKASIDASLTSLSNGITSLNNSISTINTRLSHINEELPIGVDPSEPDEFTLMANGNVQTLDGTTFTINTPGLYMINAHTEIDTRNYGNIPRYLGFYTRIVGGHDIGGEPFDNYNLQLDKFSIRGDEPAMITQAASLSNNTILDVLNGEEYRIKLAVRCNSSVMREFSGLYWYSVTRLK